MVDPKEKSADKESGEPLLLDRPAWASKGFITRKHFEDWKDRNVGLLFRSLKESSVSQESEQIAGVSPYTAPKRSSQTSACERNVAGGFENVLGHANGLLVPSLGVLSEFFSQEYRFPVRFL